MSVPMVSKCCFCAGLVTGSLIIGYLYTIIALLEIVFHGLILLLVPLKEWETAERSAKIKFCFSVFSVLFCILQVFVGILLILGTTKRKAGLMLPWTVTVSISAGVSFLLFLIGISLLIQNIVVGDEIFMIAVHFVKTCLSVYCVMVVHSLHKQILKEKLMRAYAYRAIATDLNLRIRPSNV